MRDDKTLASRAWRRLAHGFVAACGVLSIVGSGGGVGDLDFCFDVCGPLKLPPSVSITPTRMTVQLGATATFTASVRSYVVPQSVNLRWCRRPKGEALCVDIAGATGDTLTVTGANLGDDGAQFQAMVTDANGTGWATSALSVSSAPGVVFADTEFVDSNWTVRAVVDPVQANIAHTESQVATGGNPGAFRLVNYVMPSVPSSLKIFHKSTTDTYDPAVLGAVYVMDFAVDCTRLDYDGGISVPSLTPMIEQNGRIFIPQSDEFDGVLSCFGASSWLMSRSTTSVRADEFALVDGPACGFGEACPDFSGQASPIRFGFVTSAEIVPGSTPGSLNQGIDNWKATVWRR